MSAGTPINSAATDPDRKELRIRTTSDPAHLAEVRLAVESLAQTAGFDDAAVGDIGLCVNEAMANVTRHAYAGATDKPIELNAKVEPTGPANCCSARLTVTIRDWGNGVDPSKLPPRQRDPETPGGLGLICMRQMMDTAEYAPQSDGMLLTLTKCRAP